MLTNSPAQTNAFVPDIFLPERTPRILIVDDILENLQVLRGRLRLKGYELREASSGKEALEYLEQTSEYLDALPDLILLDVQMPEMDGFEVCRKIKENMRLREIPIIFITARGEMDDIVQGFTLGAVDYVVKPFHASELLTRVKTHLDLKFSRDALHRNNALLEKLNREKSEFMSMAAHDLKNPLATIRWLTDLLKSGTLPQDKASDTLDNITLAADRMFRLVKNLLDVNAIEEASLMQHQGAEASLHLPPEVVNVVFIAAEVLGNYTEQAEKKGIATSFSNSAPNAHISINPEILSQILDNLVSNAVKYTAHGGSIHLITQGNDEVVEIVVEDTGIGISENEVPTLFTKFGTTSSRPTAGEDSTGLGLFIVRKLTEAAGGNIRYEPSSPNGSRFIASFPTVKRNESLPLQETAKIHQGNTKSMEEE